MAKSKKKLIRHLLKFGWDSICDRCLKQRICAKFAHLKCCASCATKLEKLQAYNFRVGGRVQTPRQIEYAAYLQSEHWKLFRISILAKRGAICENCRNHRQVELHHLSYQRLGWELDSDIRVLCKPCHRDQHIQFQVRPSIRKAHSWASAQKDGPQRATPAATEVQQYRPRELNGEKRSTSGEAVSALRNRNRPGSEYLGQASA